MFLLKHPWDFDAVFPKEKVCFMNFTHSKIVKWWAE